MASAIGSRYAKALVDVITGTASDVTPRQAVEQIRSFEALMTESPELRHVLLAPAVAKSAKRGVVSRLAADLSIAGAVRNFLFVVVDHRRIGQLGEIRDAVEAEFDERMGIVRADVASARELTPDQREAVKAELANLTGKQVRCEFSVRDDLIGGAVARIGSTIYDGSVKGQLAELRKHLVE